MKNFGLMILLAVKTIYAGPDEDLASAIARCNLKAAKTALENDANPNLLMGSDTAIRQAIFMSKLKNQNPQSSGAWVKETDRERCFKIMELLLSKGADLGCFTEYDGTLYANCSIVQEIPEFETPKYLEKYWVGEKTARKYYEVILKYHPDAIKNSPSPLVFWSVAASDMKKLKYLLEMGADIDKGDAMTALMYASREGQIKFVQYLLSQKANPNIVNGEGKTALDYAKENNRAKIVKLLEKHMKSMPVEASEE